MWWDYKDGIEEEIYEFLGRSLRLQYALLVFVSRDHLSDPIRKSSTQIQRATDMLQNRNLHVSKDVFQVGCSGTFLWLEGHTLLDELPKLV